MHGSRRNCFSSLLLCGLGKMLVPATLTSCEHLGVQLCSETNKLYSFEQSCILEQCLVLFVLQVLVWIVIWRCSLQLPLELSLASMTSLCIPSVPTMTLSWIYVRMCSYDLSNERTPCCVNLSFIKWYLYYSSLPFNN